MPAGNEVAAGGCPSPADGARQQNERLDDHRRLKPVLTRTKKEPVRRMGVNLEQLQHQNKSINTCLGFSMSFWELCEDTSEDIQPGRAAVLFPTSVC